MRTYQEREARIRHMPAPRPRWAEAKDFAGLLLAVASAAALAVVLAAALVRLAQALFGTGVATP